MFSSPSDRVRQTRPVERRADVLSDAEPLLRHDFHDSGLLRLQYTDEQLQKPL